MVRTFEEHAQPPPEDLAGLLFGTYRHRVLSLLFLRVNKLIRLGQNRRLEVMANVVNALQNKSPSDQFFTFNFFSPRYAEPSRFPQPRQLYLGARVFF